MDANREIHDFLKARRNALTPSDVELPWELDGRRVPGLRREEVARLAGVSTDYYTKLEQGRAANVSRQVLEAVSDALRLDGLERAHLISLAEPRPATPLPKTPSATRRRVTPSVQAVLDALGGEAVAYIRDFRMDIVASNRLWRRLFRTMNAAGEGRANIARWLFCEQGSRDMYPEWETIAREIVDTLHRAAAQHPGDPGLNGLLRELAGSSTQFSAWWAEHGVYQRSSGAKSICDPEVGEIRLRYDAFAVVGDEELTLVVYTAPPGSKAQEQLRRLAR